MGRHEMLDLSHEILAELDADDLPSRVPDNSGSGGAAQVQAVLAAEHPPLPAETSVDRLIAAAEDLESSFDGLDLESVLAGVAPDFDGLAARQIYRDRFFARISNPDFLGEML
jgi:hypothetical protein